MSLFFECLKMKVYWLYKVLVEVYSLQKNYSYV